MARRRTRRCRRRPRAGSTISTSLGLRNWPRSAHLVSSPIRRRARTCCNRRSRRWRRCGGPVTSRRPAARGRSSPGRCREARVPPAVLVGGRTDHAAGECTARVRSIATGSPAGLRRVCRRRACDLRGAATRDCARHRVDRRQQGQCRCFEKPKKKRGSRSSPYIAPPVQRAVRLIRHVAKANPWST